MKIQKHLRLFLITLIFSIPILSISQTKIADINECEKATGMSESLGVSVAEWYKVPYSSIKFISTSLDKKYSMCYLKFDTSIGPKRCLVSRVFTDGKDFWVGGGCN
jgi:hypothetical protein